MGGDEEVRFSPRAKTEEVCGKVEPKAKKTKKNSKYIITYVGKVSMRPEPMGQPLARKVG